MNIKNLWKTSKVFKIATFSAAAAMVIAGSLFLYQNIKNNYHPSSKQTSMPNSTQTSTNNPADENTVPGITELDLSSLPTNSMAYYLSQNGASYINPNLSLTGREIIQPEPGEIGTWDIPIPLFNPLGSKDLYDDVRYHEKSHMNVQYISNFEEYEKTLFGEYWALFVNNNSGLPIQFLKDYAEKLGAEIFSSIYGDSIIFRLVKEDSIWWCNARESHYGYEFFIIKQNVYITGKEYTISGDTLKNIRSDEVYFCTEHKGDKFQTAYISIPSGKVRLHVNNIFLFGNSSSYNRYDVILDSAISNYYILDNIPQIEGIYDWYIEPYRDEVPSSLTFRVEESYAIPKIKAGNELGALLVKGIPFGTVYVKPQKFVQIDYREANQRTLYGDQYFEGSLTPEGDTLFSLPPGLWTIIYNAPYMNYGSVQTQLVPVNSGEQTIVTLPQSVKSASTRLNSMADDSELTGGIEITEAKDLINKAEISVSVSDPLDRDINPTTDNTVIYEGSSKVDVTDIKRVVAPCSIALVIDSSGSMKSDMTGTLEAAKTFLQTLPEGSYVKVIDFDIKVKVLKGETPAEAIKSLSEITSGGYTKLYDATLKGLETVTGKTRPAVVVFTDGRDSSHDKTGGGSSNSKNTVIQKIKESKIPVYTIGFGKRLNEEQAASGVVVDGVPDIQCLLDFASAANGQYYPAKDPEALPGVFAAISSKLGNNFVITYTRPTEHNLSETPFVSMVVDNSGSMNMHPSEGEDCDYRMEKTIGLFHNFLEKLPPNVMMQLTTFQTPTMSPPLIIQQQTTTDSKAHILKALGEMESKGGTPVIEALQSAYENIIPVPSSRKVIVFLTDGGLAVPEDQIQQYNDILEKIKKKNISILFIGMSAHSKEQIFADAANATGGDYVIGEDINAIETKLNQLLNTLKETTPSESIPISISINWDTSEGELSYAVADEVKFSLPQKAGPPLDPDMVKTETGIPYKRYNTTAAAVTGMGIPGVDNVITNSVSFNKKLSNNAMELTVKNATYLPFFQGVDAQRDWKQFVALEIEIENKTKENIPYLIPSIFKHFYVGVNQEGLYPASKATWLSDKPIAEYGNPEIRIEPGQKSSGVIVFVVPNSQSISQLSLHFYDTSYGHIQMPLAGKMSEKWLELEKLPQTAPTSLSDTFTMNITGKSLKTEIEQYKANEFSTYQIIEADFESEVQALLNFDPKERLWLEIESKSGSLMSQLSTVTDALPLGFLEPVMLAPSSINAVRMAYEIPYLMGKYKSNISVDLATGNKQLPITSGEPYGAPTSVAQFDGPGFNVTVNQLVAVDDSLTLTKNNNDKTSTYYNTVILDVTFTDIPSNEGTRIPTDFFCLVNKNYQAPSGGVTAGHIGIGGGGEQSRELIPMEEYATRNLIFGVDSNFGVFEGQSRRGIVIFRKPNDSISDWTLQSPYIENLQVPISEGNYASPELLGKKTEISISKEFEEKLEAEVKVMVEKYAALQKETSALETIGLSDEDGLKNVPTPSISTYGLKYLDSLTNETQLIRTLQGLKCLPINRNEGYLLSYGYEPEAVISQGWGEIGDLTNLAVRVLSRLGYSPEVKALSLTEAGKQALTDFSGVKVEWTKPLGISYRNSAGESKTLVIPFMMDLSELEGFVYYQTDNNAGYLKYDNRKAYIEVYARYEPGTNTGSAAGTAGDIGGILGGDEGGSNIDRLLMLSTEIPINELSKDAIDLCFMPANAIGEGKSYYALLSTPQGLITGQAVLENPVKVLGIEIAIKNISGYDTLTHYSTLGDGDSLDEFFQTIAINLPDLTEEAAALLDETARQVHDSAKNPNPLSIAKWYGRNVLYQYIVGSSMFDNQMVNELGLVLGRITKPRCLIVTSHLDKDNNMHTTLDLLQPWNEIHAGEDNAKNAYNTMSGFYLSDLEGEVLPGNNKVSYLDLWQQAPSGTVIQTIPVMDNNRDEILARMEAEEKYPYSLLSAVKENRNLIFAPTQPTIFMGQERWAWLEINPETYKVISVFDNGLHAGMAEFSLSLQPSRDDTVKWMKGIWVGTNISVWTMCSSTLKYGDNYKAVLADAYKTANEAAKVVADFFEMADNIKNMELSFEMELPGGGHKIEFKIGMAGIKGSVAQKMYSYSGGMKLAIDAYFKSIVPQPETPGPPKQPKEYEP